MKNIYKYYQNLRLKPNHNISQWYMYLNDAKKQVNYLLNNIKGSIVFLGDGDGIGILLALKCKEKHNNITKICVLDIDEREINLYNKISKENGLNNFKANIYNIFDKLPNKLKNNYDNFYINPPYSSTTSPKGIGFILWLERCIELTKPEANGIIVYPKVNKKRQWTNEVKNTISNFLDNHNFKIKTDNCLMHRYYETEIKSTNLLVQKTDNTESDYKYKSIPKNIAYGLYHNDFSFPQYIKDDGTADGKPVYFKESNK